jgi:fluoroquinolone resistance protein
MEHTYAEEKTFHNNDFTQNPLNKGEYECYTFINCDFSNSDLAETIFVECVFEGMARLIMTAFRDIKFRNCKMLGLHFENCNKFGLTVNFENCNLNHSSFYQLKLKKTTFKNLKLHEVDFSGCDLSNSVFDNCDLTKATFENTIIEKVDFRTSFNYSIDPEINRIKKAKFSLGGVTGLLYKYDIEIDINF